MLQIITQVLFAVVDGALVTLDAASKTYDRVRKLAGLLRKKPAPDETPIPLTHRSVEYQREQMREATTRRDAIRPPRDSSRDR